MRRNGFDEDRFMQYLQDNFSGFENHFLREIVSNIIDYAYDHEHISKDQFCFFMCDMIPEIDFGDVAMFCDDDILSVQGQQEKRNAMLNMGET